ncbi:hypothetical protein LCGC14_0840010 [marine sediment metagenome]|uniref:Uncharacterized protein n=1 Tax=marine sediment metagenome TaxID=412755 RepID=A0A0F9SKS9_9ZZZZ
MQIARNFIREYPELRRLWTLEEIKDILDLELSYDALIDAKNRSGSQQVKNRLLDYLGRFDWTTLPTRTVDDIAFWVLVLRALRDETHAKSPQAKKRRREYDRSPQQLVHRRQYYKRPERRQYREERERFFRDYRRQLRETKEKEEQG